MTLLKRIVAFLTFAPRWRAEMQFPDARAIHVVDLDTAEILARAYEHQGIWTIINFKRAVGEHTPSFATEEATVAWLRKYFGWK